MMKKMKTKKNKITNKELKELNKKEINPSSNNNFLLL